MLVQFTIEPVHVQLLTINRSACHPLQRSKLEKKICSKRKAALTSDTAMGIRSSMAKPCDARALSKAASDGTKIVPEVKPLQEERGVAVR